MRRVHGWLGTESNDPDDHAPFVGVRLIYDAASHSIDFMIDTGSDATILMPRDAHWVLDDRYFEMDFRSHPESVPLQGIGEREIYMTPLKATLVLTDDTDSPIELAQRIWIAEPQPDYRSEEGNWLVPSLFGRDAIRPGEFELSYVNRTVTLTRPDYE